MKAIPPHLVTDNNHEMRCEFIWTVEVGDAPERGSVSLNRRTNFSECDFEGVTSKGVVKQLLSKSVYFFDTGMISQHYLMIMK